MKVSVQKLFLSLLAFFATTMLKGQNAPFQLHLEPLTITGLPGMHSFAATTHNGLWLLVGGRLDGLHGTAAGGNIPFPVAQNNENIYVVNPLTGQTWSASLASLAVDIKEQLRASNTQYCKNGNILYVVGGYGYSSVVSNHVTFDKLTAIDVPNIMHAIMNGLPINAYFRQISDAAFKVTGGQLEKIYDTYYLVGGHLFDGVYGAGQPHTQLYTNQIRRFTLIDNGAQIIVNHMQPITDSVNLHRRDYNMSAQIMPNQTEGLTAFSGVFQYTASVPYLNCVNIDSSGYAVNNAFSQYYNHYQCANLPIYSALANEMHTLFFGGIAQYYDSSGILVQDNLVPFTKTIARVTRTASGMMSEYKLPIEMPSLLGAGSEFIKQDGLPYYGNGVLKLDSLPTDTTLVGYVFGGIFSPTRNVFGSPNNGTLASNNLFKAYIIKSGSSTNTHHLNPQSVNNLQLQVYPNPNNGTMYLNFNLTKPSKVILTIRDITGKLVKDEFYNNLIIGANQIQIKNTDLGGSGIYLLTLTTDDAVATQKIVIHSRNK